MTLYPAQNRHHGLIITHCDSQAAFIGGYTPHPIDAPTAAPLPGTPRTPGGGEDPRVALNRKHQEFLAKKEKEEQVTKGQLLRGGRSEGGDSPWAGSNSPYSTLRSITSSYAYDERRHQRDFLFPQLLLHRPFHLSPPLPTSRLARRLPVSVPRLMWPSSMRSVPRQSQPRRRSTGTRRRYESTLKAMNINFIEGRVVKGLISAEPVLSTAGQPRGGCTARDHMGEGHAADPHA